MDGFIFDRKMAEDKKFWLQHQASIIHRGALRLDQARPSGEEKTYQSLDFEINGDLFEKLQTVAKGPFLKGTVLLAGFAGCLYKYSGYDTPRQIIGTPSRKNEDKKHNNLVPVWVDLSKELSFKSLLMAMRQNLLEAYGHQSYPYQKLIEDFGEDQKANRFALCDVLLSYDEIHEELDEIETDIALFFSDCAQGLSGRLTYRSDLFESGTIELLVQHFTYFLNQALSNLDQEIAQIDVIDPKENHQKISVWNDTEIAFPQNSSIIDILEDVTQKYPDNPALVLGEKVLSYREMMALCDKIAINLQEQGIERDDLVGVSLSNPMETVLSFIGILKAGAAFVAMDASYPDDRLSYMLSDSGTKRVICEASFVSRVGEADYKALSFENISLAPISKVDTLISASPTDRAYVIYTSGSTGKPKGTVLEHRGLCNLAMGQSRIFNVDADSRVLQFASFSFDASISEIFIALVKGAALHLAYRDDLAPIDPLMNVLKNQEITHVTLPPSLLSVLPDDPLPHLKNLIVAGESCPADLAEKWSKGRAFFNGYGPTESTVCASIGCYGGKGKPMIGRPFDNTHIHILDEDLNPLPVGLVGELYIDSVGLAREYLGRPDLTAQKFIQNPFEQGFSDRLYKSGDWARWRADGELEFFGRIDHQVKVRGFRIELDEIAQCLCEHDAVLNASVIVNDEVLGDVKILAFVQSEQDITEVILQEFLSERLPEYMRPSSLFVMAQFPLLPNGKINRNELLAHAKNAADEKGNKAIARDMIELKLVQIWQDVLEKNAIGLRDNFFALGGHSILAVKLLSRIQQVFDQKYPLDQVFKYPTIEQFATLLRSGGKMSVSETPLVEVNPMATGEEAPVFCMHPAGGRVLCYIPFAQEMGDISICGLQARGFEAGQHPYEDLEEMTSAYVLAIKEHQPKGPYRLVGWSGGAVIAFEVACKLQEGGDEVSSLNLLDAYAPSQLPEKIKNLDDVELFKALISEEHLTLSIQNLRALSQDQLMAAFRDMLIKADLIPEDYGLEDVTRFFDVYRKNCSLAHVEISRQFKGDVQLFKAEEEQKLRDEYSPDDPLLGWRRHVEGGIKEIDVSGNHTTMMEVPHVAEFAAEFKKQLA